MTLVPYFYTTTARLVHWLRFAGSIPAPDIQIVGQGSLFVYVSLMIINALTRQEEVPSMRQSFNKEKVLHSRLSLSTA